MLRKWSFLGTRRVRVQAESGPAPALKLRYIRTSSCMQHRLHASDGMPQLSVFLTKARKIQLKNGESGASLRRRLGDPAQLGSGLRQFALGGGQGIDGGEPRRQPADQNHQGLS